MATPSYREQLQFKASIDNDGQKPGNEHSHGRSILDETFER
jgi:hypothetical protein